MNTDDKVMRSFDTGATRDTAEGKLDMEGFTHPMVMKQFAKYMNMNRLQSDGQLRDSDNWQKGIPIDAYMKSLKRHVDEVWLNHRGFRQEAGPVAALCGIMFNSMGMLHEILKVNDWKLQDFDDTMPTPEMKGRQDALRRKGEMNAEGQLLLPLVPEPTSFCGSIPDNRCHDCTPQCDYNIPEPDPKPFKMDKTGFCMCEFDATCGDCLCVVDCGNMIVDTNNARFAEDQEKLEDVPGLPMCFGWCGVEHCGNCPDKPECDTMPECTDCDFRSECATDWGRGAEAAHKLPVTPMIHTFEPPVEVPEGKMLMPVVHTDEVLPVFKNSGCNGCMSRMKLFSLYPCNECFRNNKTSFNCHDYYVHQDEC
jgi:hypothetical protein